MTVYKQTCAQVLGVDGPGTVGLPVGEWAGIVKMSLFSSRSFYCAVAGSLSLGPSGNPDLLLHRPPACLFSNPLACSLRGLPGWPWLFYLVACHTSGS